ncbi:DUF6182 family protein [Streptomyces sp. NPDC047928]|uniref:DUF6182 family protein n=1 Tax=unclassified Streptomyces TaxID=2593676 RepID=UPI0037110C0F
MTRPVLSRRMLLDSAAERVRRFRPDLSARVDLSTPAALRAVRDTLADRVPDDGAEEAVVVCVVRRFALPSWVREVCAFALSVPEARRDPWRRSFTRTLHLAGRPDNLARRFAFDHVAADGSVGWAGPLPEAATAGPRRLLKPFEGGHALPSWAPTTVDVPEGGVPEGGRRRAPVHRDLYVATHRVTVAATLVHLHHLLAEAVLDGLIAPGDRLTLRAVPRLSGLPGPFAALRVDGDVHHPRELQAYAGLTEET